MSSLTIQETTFQTEETSISQIMDVSSALKALYLGTAAVILLVYAVRPLKERFLAYGARSASDKIPTDPLASGSQHDAAPETLRVSLGSFSVDALLDFLATFQVPHSWFMSFYLASVTSSIIWQHQLSMRGTLYQTIATYNLEQRWSMSLEQIALCWSLMALQGIRRLRECFAFSKQSKSSMWIFHWVVGVIFYVATGIAIWIEGIPALESTGWTSASIRLSAPSLRTSICLPIFLLASFVQHDVHRHLASLKKYTLPAHPAFRAIVCPHYTAECVLYAALTFLAAPEGTLINNTVLCATVFVVVNLGITADISRTWAIEKFGKEKVQNKWRMLPGIW